MRLLRGARGAGLPRPEVGGEALMEVGGAVRVREPFESRERAVREPLESRYMPVREPLHGR